MRLGVVYDPAICPYYRAIDPMRAMERRGHEVVWPDSQGRLDMRRLTTCDVVHVYRLAGMDNARNLASFTRKGVPLTYDHDDNVAALTVSEAQVTGKRVSVEAERVYASTVRIARAARVFTTTTPHLAEIYRQAGVGRVEVIRNALSPDVTRRRSRHSGVVVGWIAGVAHRADVSPLKLREALLRLVDEHDDVRVECVGVDLDLPEKYRHDRWVPFEALPQRIGGFDIGIAPLADTPVNRARSDIKVKEYAASGVPWLASPVGGYESLGEPQGGRLVEDGRWFEALDRLVTSRRDRRRLARRARKWASAETIDSTAEAWEGVFREAAVGDSPVPTPTRG